ncbi:hypothetical protein QWZ08_13505 [Ferruginibacter paludis]|uniref:hypothetical protein n=1 Tax=Ferruginibacter paludis TaxID=1310417 RepID=UPI0025B5930D|nr:hypothetical protein [Ferruginibacter paludis]MDN3656655.1 hypothetical protein [Ferruginibacter paludis]
MSQDGNRLQSLKNIVEETRSMVVNLSEENFNYWYSQGKWILKDIVLHHADCERIIIYRALRIARSDDTNLPGFDKNLFVSTTSSGSRTTQKMLWNNYPSTEQLAFFYWKIK